MNTAKLDAFIFDKMSATRLPGLSIALVRDAEVIYARGFGQANIEKNRAATQQTLYGAASITKSFIAIAVASDQPIMPGAPAIPPGAIVEGELFSIAGCRHPR